MTVSAQKNADNFPLISIVMPAYNASAFIAVSIQSVLDQTYSHWQLVIVDDASTDNTVAIIQQFSDPRIQLIQAKKSGRPSRVRNIGLKQCNGALITFLDADDCYFPNTLAKLSKPLRQSDRVSVVYGFAKEVSETGEPVAQLFNLIENEKATPAIADDDPAFALPATYNHSWFSIATGQISCVFPGLMLRRETVNAVGDLNETLATTEDYEYYARLFIYDYNGIYCLSDYVYQYRIHSQSLTKTPQHSAQLLNDSIQVLDWLFNDSQMPAYAQAYREKAYTDAYRYLARERVVHNQNKLARKIIFKAAADAVITRQTFYTTFFPLFVRALLPARLNQWLINAKRFFH
ncbi:MAG: glycosyltransferase [Cyanobacteria bacterium P01_H01_bin.74]